MDKFIIGKSPSTSLTKDDRVRNILLGMGSGDEPNWPGLSGIDGRATKKRANKFMLGAIMDYQMPADKAWENARILSEEILGDPDDLWGVIARMPSNELARLFRGPPTLHRFVKDIPKRVQRISNDIIRKYDGDARRIWEGHSTDEIMRRLKDVCGGEQIPRMIRGALYDTSQIDGKGELKADIHVRRVLGRVYEGDMVSAEEALKIANRLVPDDSWKLDYPLYRTGWDVCKAQEPACDYCTLTNECVYNAAHGVIIKLQCECGYTTNHDYPGDRNIAIDQVLDDGVPCGGCGEADKAKIIDIMDSYEYYAAHGSLITLQCECGHIAIYAYPDDKNIAVDQILDDGIPCEGCGEADKAKIIDIMNPHGAIITLQCECGHTVDYDYSDREGLAIGQVLDDGVPCDGCGEADKAKIIDIMNH